MLGKDFIKHSILKQEGFDVLVIPYYEWYILEEE
jgi:hypothetical protein